MATKIKGYVPKFSNSTVRELPAEYEQYRDPPTITDTITPAESAFVSPDAVAAVDGSAAAKEVKKTRERKEGAKKVKEKVLAKTATDRYARGDPLAMLFAEVARDPEQARKAKHYAPFKDSFREDLLEGEEEFPLVKFMDGQKAITETIPYSLDVPVYMPSTRKAFYAFIQDTYAKEFNLAGDIKEPDPKACEKLMKGGEGKVEPFRYQRFISEYIRQSSPYRGMLVYHGLGSGKTCSSVAAAEALYGVANKKIIVMTPQSLRDNYIKEITFCGFRHFSIHNHWIKIPLLERELGEDGKIHNQLFILHEIYGRSVLSLSKEYIERIINYAKSQKELVNGEYQNAWLWIADFDKEPNYKSLTPSEQDQIRNQLKETIMNRIQFIHYNGIKNAELLSLCCTEGAFDNAVIVVDEIHNLIRLMRNTIEPFLIKRSTKERLLEPEPITVDPWKPYLCGKKIMGKNGKPVTYSRGFMFYRLLVGARNSKIIGLSGTPIINFPEEIGILANVLAGYIFCAEFTLNTMEASKAKAFEALANKDIRVDFVFLEVAKDSRNYTGRISIFNEGYLKVLAKDGTTFEGVRQVNAPEARVGIKEVMARLLLGAGSSVTIPKESIKYVAYPRLPPFQDPFRAEFIDIVNTGLNKTNEIILKKRLTGLISYYKGNKPDFFPSVTKDEIIECDFSLFALKKYITERLREIREEANKEIADKGANLYAAVEAYSKAANPSNYRFRSRAVCNFAFPFDRPYTANTKELEAEVEEMKEDLEVTEASSDPELDLALAADIADEESAVSDDLGLKPFEPTVESVEDDSALDLLTSAVTKTEKAVAATAGKSYPQLKKELMEKLNAERDTYLKLTPEGLQKYSCKLFEILTRMATSPGPALVYSQFEELEGMGVLAASLQANGYEPVKFTGKWFGPEPEFTPESLASLAKGPGVNRFMVFSGKEDRRQRAITLAIFNSQWENVPKGIRSILEKGKIDLKKKYLHGEIIKCIGITGAGAEGISLRNVRQVHIMEPFWNMVRTEQVKGRAVRICSHMDLPVDERKVDIFTYVSRFSPEQVEKRDMEGGIPRSIQSADGDIDPETKKQRLMTSDQRVLNVGVRKELISKQLQQIMKEVAVDCTMNAADNEPISCLVLDTKGTNPYLFDPNLEQDKITTQSEIVLKEEPVAAKAVPKSIGFVTQKFKFTVAGKTRSYIRSPFNPVSGKATIHAADDTLLKRPLGECYEVPGTVAGIGRIRFYKTKVAEEPVVEEAVVEEAAAEAPKEVGEAKVVAEAPKEVGEAKVAVEGAEE